MSITEITTIPLEGEQLACFQGLDEREVQALAPFRAERNAMVSAILAGKGLLAAVAQTPGIGINVGPDGIRLSPPEPSIERSLKLEDTGD